MRRLTPGPWGGFRLPPFPFACRRYVFGPGLAIAGKGRQARRFDCYGADLGGPARAGLHQRLLTFLDLGSGQNLDGIDRRARFFETGFDAAFPSHATSAASPPAPPTPTLGITFLLPLNFLAFAATALAGEISL